jgi:hypothetical protein
MITPSGTLSASAKVAPPSPHACSDYYGNVTGMQPPVSATTDKVYFRDGDSAIRYLTPDGQVGLATTVPGDSATLSFFSVSPDDRRIAVMVEDFSPADRIGLTLYTEDLAGHANHKVIYTGSSSRYVTGRTLWPMGWHRGMLVLGVFATCPWGQESMIPTEWHVADPSTGARVAKLGNPCEPSYWPSPAGVVCIWRATPPAWTLDLDGKLTNHLSLCCDDWQSGLSPSGQRFFITPRPGLGVSPSTKIIAIDGSPPETSCCNPTAMVPGRSACLWIDESHLLAPDAIIDYEPNGVAGSNPGQTAAVIPFPAAGQCAGRFPGGL